ncbi:hypothetical protein BKA69DRAFT_1070453 [Paraphysoderma sedebokerense]|nr:hypothetical protein BKA69DRAFT_1070453 [Paraphysoderma sedebokerense]
MIQPTSSKPSAPFSLSAHTDNSNYPTPAINTQPNSLAASFPKNSHLLQVPQVEQTPRRFLSAVAKIDLETELNPFEESFCDLTLPPPSEPEKKKVDSPKPVLPSLATISPTLNLPLDDRGNLIPWEKAVEGRTPPALQINKPKSSGNTPSIKENCTQCQGGNPATTRADPHITTTGNSEDASQISQRSATPTLTSVPPQRTNQPLERQSTQAPIQSTQPSTMHHSHPLATAVSMQTLNGYPGAQPFLYQYQAPPVSNVPLSIQQYNAQNQPQLTLMDLANAVHPAQAQVDQSSQQMQYYSPESFADMTAVPPTIQSIPPHYSINPSALPSPAQTNSNNFKGKRKTPPAVSTAAGLPSRRSERVAKLQTEGLSDVPVSPASPVAVSAAQNLLSLVSAVPPPHFNVIFDGAQQNVLLQSDVNGNAQGEQKNGSKRRKRGSKTPQDASTASSSYLVDLNGVEVPPIPPLKKGNSKRKVNYDRLDSKRKSFLERNRQAALKCRQKKKHYTAQLQARIDYFTMHNTQLQAQINSFREEIGRLRMAIDRNLPLCPSAGQGLI